MGSSLIHNLLFRKRDLVLLSAVIDIFDKIESKTAFDGNGLGTTKTEERTD